jgi:pseudoazurin
MEKKLRKLLLVLISIFLTTYASAETHEILMVNKDGNGNRNVFLPEVIQVSAGDTVKWFSKDRGHNVEMVSSPNKIKFKSKLGKDTSMIFEEPGVYYYWCTPHKGMGMIGLVVVDGDLSNIQEVEKAKALGKSKKKLKSLLGELSGEK